MSSKQIKVWIVLPIFNGEKYILEQVMSIYNQTHINRELIIINDYSSDNTANIIKQFIWDYKLESKVYFYENEKNLWVNKTIEKWLKIIEKIWKKWDFVSYCDADDIRTRNKIETQVYYMKKNNYNISYHDLVIINSDNEMISPSFQFKLITPTSNTYNNSFHEFCISQHVTSTSMMFKFELIENLFPFSNAIYQDYWTILVFSIINSKKIWYINKKLWFYRKHEWSISLKKTKIEDLIQKNINILGDVYKITGKKELLKYIKINEQKKIYSRKQFYKAKTMYYTLTRYPDIFLLLIKKIITYPIRKIWWYFIYKI